MLSQPARCYFQDHCHQGVDKDNTATASNRHLANANVAIACLPVSERRHTTLTTRLVSIAPESSHSPNLCDCATTTAHLKMSSTSSATHRRQSIPGTRCHNWPKICRFQEHLLPQQGSSHDEAQNCSLGPRCPGLRMNHRPCVVLPNAHPVLNQSSVLPSLNNHPQYRQMHTAHAQASEICQTTLTVRQQDAPKCKD